MGRAARTGRPVQFDAGGAGTPPAEVEAITRENASQDHARTLQGALDSVAPRHRRLLLLLRRLEGAVVLSGRPAIPPDLWLEIQTVLKAEKIAENG
jgi:hypothetical protein